MNSSILIILDIKSFRDSNPLWMVDYIKKKAKEKKK